MKFSSQLTSIFLFLFCSFGLTAQTITIKGSVLDKENSEPLPFAYVILKGANIATVTDGNGNFKMEFSSKYKESNLLFTYLGYDDKKILVSDLIIQRPVVVKLNSTALAIDELVFVSKKKLISPKSLLRKVIKNIPKNYAQDTTQINGYYRETMKENGGYIKYADAPTTMVSTPYLNKKYKRKAYSSPFSFSAFGSLNTFGGSWGLHRIHFHHRTLRGDHAEIIKARSSDNLSYNGTNPSIEGGPLSLFSRDAIKYQEAFTGRKKFRDFDYSVEEDNRNGQLVYILKFKTTTTKAKLDELGLLKKPKFGNGKQWKHANKHKLLQGQIIIDKKNYAVLEFECSVPNELKDYFCGYKYENFKHFDYKVHAKYAKNDSTYYLDYIKHEDEFLILDSLSESRTPYAAISEFWTRSIDPNGINIIPKKRRFENVNSNLLHEFPVEYDSLFWANYSAEEPLAQIPTAIRIDMEGKKSLEAQFREKYIRDEDMIPPVAKIQPLEIKIHGTKLIDTYAWLKAPKYAKRDTAIMNYINAENAFSENYFRPLKKEQKLLFTELTSHIEKDYKSLPTFENGYAYYYRYAEDEDYPTYYRHPERDSAAEEVLLDVNTMAEEYNYYNISAPLVSPGNKIMAYAENTTGGDQYVLRFKDLANGMMLKDSLTNMAGGIWFDDQTLLYIVQENSSLRAYQLKAHKLNTPQSTDKILYEEVDNKFSITIGRSKSKAYIFLTSSSSTTSETKFINATDSTFTFQTIHGREPGHMYYTSHYQDQFYILTDKYGDNYSLYTVETTNPTINNWKPLIDHNPEMILTSYLNFDDFFVIKERIGLNEQIKVIDRKTRNSHYIKFQKNIHNVSIGYNPKTKSNLLRLNYNSPSEPSTVYDYNMATKDLSIIKEDKKFPFIWHKSIKTERIWATARDGKMVPMTVMYQKWFKPKSNSTNKVKTFMTSYGSYGSSSNLGYDPAALALIRKGFIYVVAHVRGGSDLGKAWYEDGKMLKKKNTFTDFIDCAEHLIEKGYATKGQITAQGGSAGGLLMGAIMNMRPDLWKTVILDVPFVDVVNTMMDERLPLTTGEYEEWGDPNIKKFFKYMKSYSPYDNVAEQAYPNMLFYTAMNDNRVGYWEAAKMVAKLRNNKTDDNVLLLHTNINAGHSGGSGRFEYYSELAQKYVLMYEMYRKDQ